MNWNFKVEDISDYLFGDRDNVAVTYWAGAIVTLLVVFFAQVLYAVFLTKKATDKRERRQLDKLLVDLAWDHDQQLYTEWLTKEEKKGSKVLDWLDDDGVFYGRPVDLDMVRVSPLALTQQWQQHADAAQAAKPDSELRALRGDLVACLRFYGTIFQRVKSQDTDAGERREKDVFQFLAHFGHVDIRLVERDTLEDEEKSETKRENVAWLHAVYVVPDCRTKGLGARMIEKVVALLKKLNSDVRCKGSASVPRLNNEQHQLTSPILSANVMCDARNDAALNLFTHCHFEEQHIQVRIDKTPYDIMSLDLGGHSKNNIDEVSEGGVEGEGGEGKESKDKGETRK